MVELILVKLNFAIVKVNGLSSPGRHRSGDMLKWHGLTARQADAA